MRKLALLALILPLMACSDTPTDPPCDENHPNWPDCHDQGSGNGGQ